MTAQPSDPKETSLLEASTSYNLVRSIDQNFRRLTLALAISVGLILLWIAYSLLVIALPAIQAFGLGFLFDSTWDPVKNIYGALPHVYGTVLSSLLALIFAVPLGVGVAIFLTEKLSQAQHPPADRVCHRIAGSRTECGVRLVGIILCFCQRSNRCCRDSITILAGFPSFRPSRVGRQLFWRLSSAGDHDFYRRLLRSLADTLTSLPPKLRQGAYGLGATRWETIMKVLLPAALSGIIGSIMLALGRALGETMALTMLVGNANQVNVSWLAPASTLFVADCQPVW